MRSPLDFGTIKYASRFGRDVLRSPLLVGTVQLVSRMADVPPGDGEQDWGLPLDSDVVAKLYIRMLPDFTIPLDGVPGTTAIALEPQSSPPTGRFPVEVAGQTEYVDLEFVVFV